MGDLFTDEENHRGKTLLGEFKVTILENPLLSKQAITSKGIPIPYTNLQLNPYVRNLEVPNGDGYEL